MKIKLVKMLQEFHLACITVVTITILIVVVSKYPGSIHFQMNIDGIYLKIDYSESFN